MQLGLEYAPEPPFHAGRPELAPASVLKAVEDRTDDARAARREGLEAWTMRMGVAADR